MKKRFFLFLLLCSPLTLMAQVAQWVIPPAYRKIEIPEGSKALLAQTDSQRVFFTFEGRRTGQVNGFLHPFSEGYAVATSKDTPAINAIFDDRGNATPVRGYQLGWRYPLFHDGYLLVHDGNYYRFMDHRGKVDSTPYVQAYPFSAGFAACYTYENIYKHKNPYYLLIDSKLKPVQLKTEGKPVERSDIEFISSLNDEGIAVVIIKRRIWFFHADDRELKPVVPAGDANTKNQAKLEGDFNESFTTADDTTHVLRARCGRAATVTVTFNSMIQPKAVTIGDDTITYAPKADDNRQRATHIRKFLGDDGKLALYWDEQEVLPPQFSEVPLCFDDMAVVGVDGKLGLLRILSQGHFRATINEGNPIAFRHKTYRSSIRIDMPSYISPEKASIEVDRKMGCVIDKISKQSKVSTEGNFMQYACTLDIPQDITDEASDITIPVTVVYDGLRSPVIPVSSKAWHYRYFNVEVNDQETVVNGTTLTFTFNINAERQQGEADYPYTATLFTDSLTSEMEKVSETRYKCKVFNLREGINNIAIQVLEDGCPPASYNFEVEYTRPPEKQEAKKNAKKEEEEAPKAVIKKAKKPAPKPTPRLEI